MVINLTQPEKPGFSITSHSLDVRNINLAQILKERDAGNPYAVLLEVFIRYSGLDKGLNRSTDHLLPYMEPIGPHKNPMSGVLYGIFATSKRDLARHARAHIENNLPAVLKLAGEGDNFARLIGARGLTEKGNYILAEKLLRDAQGPSPTSIPEALSDNGIAILQYELGSLLRQRVAQSRQKTEIERLENEAILLFIAAANKGHSLAQTSVGDYLSITTSPQILNSYYGEDLKERCRVAQDWLLKGQIQGVMHATYLLGCVFEVLENHEGAISEFKKYLAYPQADLPQKYIRAAQWQLVSEWEKNEEYKEAYQFCREQFEAGNPVLVHKMLGISLKGLPGFPPDDELVWRACIRALHPNQAKGWPPIEMKRGDRESWQEMLDTLQKRAWTTDERGALAKAIPSTNYKDPVPMFLPADDEERFLWLLDAATHPAALMSAAHALELAQHYATGTGCGGIDDLEARYWYRQSGELGSTFGLNEAVKRYMEGRVGAPADPVEVLRIIRAAFPNPEDARRQRDTRDLLSIEQSIMDPKDTYPRVWVAKGPFHSMRPVERADSLDDALLIPSDPDLALTWLDEAARQGSMAAASIADRLYGERGEQDKAFAMYHAAAGLGFLGAGLEVARRYFERRGTDYNPNAAYDLVTQIQGQIELLTEEETQRLSELKAGLFKEAWVLTKNNILERVHREGRADRDPKEALNVCFFPETEIGLNSLSEYQKTSFEAAIEVGRRLEEGIGSKQPNLSEAFLYYSYVIFGGDAIKSMPLPVVPANDPLRDDVLKRWKRLAALAKPTVLAEDVVRYEFEGAPQGAETLVLSTGSIWQFHRLVMAEKQGPS